MAAKRLALEHTVTATPYFLIAVTSHRLAYYLEYLASDLQGVRRAAAVRCRVRTWCDKVTPFTADLIVVFALADDGVPAAAAAARQWT